MPSRGQSTTINTNPNKVPRTTGTHNVKKHALGSARVGKVNDSSTTRSQQAQQIIEEGTKDWTKPEPDTVVGQTKKGASDLTKPTALIADLPGNQTPVPAVNAAAQRQKQIPLGEIMARLFAGFILLSGGALLVGIVGFIIQVGGANWGSVAFIGFIFSTIAILVGLKISFDGSRHHHHYHH